MDALVEFLFKYRPVVFEKGHLAFASSWGARAAVLLIGAAALAAIATYLRVRVRGSASDRLVLGGVRALAVVLLVFAVLQPVLVVPAAVPQRNVVGVLVDDSRSMRVPDVAGRPRADLVRSLLGGPDSALYKALAQRFIVRLFRVGNGSRIAGVDSLDFNASRTQFAPAFEAVRDELAGVPLAGLVLVSDGADNAPSSLGETLTALQARKLPVFTVGVGQERFAKDIEVSRVEAPRTVLKGASLVLSVDLTQRGFGGTTVPVVVEDSGRIVSSERITLPRDGDATTVHIRVPATQPGARLFTVRVALQDGELVRENNAHPVLVRVRDRKEKILYIEGEPRFELKFLRQAVAKDSNLQLVTLIRTAKEKFLRLGVDDSLELVAGFPRTREELFAYRGIILGNIEASFFTLDQLRMISEFVSERGGGLLMLGGSTSFAEGGYAGTPIADVLPVELSPDQKGKTVFHEVKVDVTRAGARYAVTQIAGSESESAKRWKTLPTVTTANVVTRAKPGAATLLAGTIPGGKDGKSGQTVVLAYQRYGRGHALAFPIQDSWLWQMHADVPLEDLTYRSFWRQVLRWLVNETPARVTVSTAADQADVNEPVRIDAEVVDRAYRKVNSATATAMIQTPSGSVLQVPLEWSVTQDGAYHVTYTPTEPGMHRIQVVAHSDGETLTSDPVFLDAGTPMSEYFGAELHTSLLQRVAKETGGQYYTAATAAQLPNDLVYSDSGTTLLERLDLWDMPILFLLLLILLAAEWGYRRSRGLV